MPSRLIQGFAKVAVGCFIKRIGLGRAIPFVLLNGWPFSLFDSSWGAGSIAHILVYIATLLSLVSGVIYVVQNRHGLASKESEE